MASGSEESLLKPDSAEAENSKPLKASQEVKCMDNISEFESPIDDMFNPNSSPPPTIKLMTTFSKLAIPNILTNMLGFMSCVAIMMYAGHYSDNPINVAVVGLAGTTGSIMVLSLLIGLNAA